MRSRFSAFVLGLNEYLLATWHPSTRPETMELDPAVTWRKLQIVDTAPGVVEFRASYRGLEGAGLLHERSRFVQEDGRWFYVDGDVD
jgi:SEC-C motif-containing protein